MKFQNQYLSILLTFVLTGIGCITTSPQKSALMVQGTPDIKVYRLPAAS